MVNVAIIPAAGRGTRMLPNTRAYPKELISFGEKPVIEHVIDSLRENNVNKIFIITGHKKAALADYLGDGSMFGVRVGYIHQEEQLGLGHAVNCAKDTIQDMKISNFMVFLGDTIIKNTDSLKKLISLHESKGAFATLLIEPVDAPERYGVVKFNDLGRGMVQISDMFEKPKSEEEKQKFKINGIWYSIAGIYVFNDKIFSYLDTLKSKDGEEMQLTDAIKDGLKRGETVYGIIMDGERIDVGNWDHLWKLRDYFRNMSDEQLEKIIKERNRIVELLKR